MVEPALVYKKCKKPICCSYCEGKRAALLLPPPHQIQVTWTNKWLGYLSVSMHAALPSCLRKASKRPATLSCDHTRGLKFMSRTRAGFLLVTTALLDAKSCASGSDKMLTE